jgi:hypothetical protein
MRPPLALGTVVLLLAVGTTGVAAVGSPSSGPTGEQRVEVVGATAVCPDVVQIPGVYQCRISVGAAPLPAGRTATGGSAVTTLVRDTAATPPRRVPLTQPGQVVAGLGTAINANGMVVTATGALATGLEVEQVSRVTENRWRGLGNLRCEAPKREAWLVGASTTLSDATVLSLANVDDTPATVDITAFGRSGPFDPRPGSGITVAAHTRLLLPLDTLAPDGAVLVVHVSSRQGRVVAALRVGRLSRGIPAGFDYVPQALPPARQVVVPGIPSDNGSRWLIVGNPTDDDTTVSVKVTLRDGQFVPSGMEEVPVLAKHTALINVSSLTATSPLTATLTSSGAPVVAAGFLLDAQLFPVSQIREIAFAGSSLPLSGSAVLTDLVIDRPTESTLILSAPDTAAAVTITPIPVRGSGAAPAPRRVAIPAGRTVSFRLSSFFPPGTRARLAVEVRPEDDSGPVYATRYLREHGARGTLSTLLTLQGPAQLVSRPTAVQDDQAGYP